METYSYVYNFAQVIIIFFLKLHNFWKQFKFLIQLVDFLNKRLKDIYQNGLINDIKLIFNK